MCKDGSPVGEVITSSKGQKPGCYRLVVKSEKPEEFATYESVRICLANLAERMEQDGLKQLKLIVDVTRWALLNLDFFQRFANDYLWPYYALTPRKCKARVLKSRQYKVKHFMNFSPFLLCLCTVVIFNAQVLQMSTSMQPAFGEEISICLPSLV